VESPLTEKMGRQGHAAEAALVSAGRQQSTTRRGRRGGVEAPAWCMWESLVPATRKRKSDGRVSTRLERDSVQGEMAARREGRGVF
jgi:hypothetical protein